MRKTVTIKVLARDLQSHVCGRCFPTDCPIARAIIRVVKDGTYVAVGGDDVVVGNLLSLPIPRKYGIRILKQDNKHRFTLNKAFSFRLAIPVELRRAS